MNSHVETLKGLKMKTLTASFVWLFNIIEFFDRLFRPTPKPTPTPEPETFPTFENDARKTVREIEEREPEPPSTEPEVRAPKGIALHKSVHFRTRRGLYLSAKVVGYSWEDDRLLALSRNGGPVFFRRFC